MQSVSSASSDTSAQNRGITVFPKLWSTAEIS